jgi:ribosomal protein S18 acetylase RimI-like enzyme
MLWRLAATCPRRTVEWPTAEFIQQLAVPRAAIILRNNHSRAQHTDYRRDYADADWLVIEREGEAVGRLYLDRRAQAHRIIDIALMPHVRNRGFGRALLRDLLDEATAAGKPVTIYVEKLNPAMRLYQRLGFVAGRGPGRLRADALDAAFVARARAFPSGVGSQPRRCATSPRRGEVGARSAPGEGALDFAGETVTPHPPALRFARAVDLSLRER